MPQADAGRVRSLDLVRGVAVLGIVAVNVAGFAGPSQSVVTPHFQAPGSPADEWAFAAVFLVFEGKMRALFTILFGASMLLFIERSDAAGKYGDVLQLRRLGWLLLFGALHYFLFWWGDILFLYALAGFLALMMRELSVKALLRTALTIFLVWHAAGTVATGPEILAEDRVRAGTASELELREHTRFEQKLERDAERQMREYRSGFAGQIETKLTQRPLRQLETAVFSLAETLPLMLLGMALYRSGFFSGGWSRLRLRWLAIGGTGLGGALTLAMLAWLWPRHFPFRATEAAMIYWAAVPHVLMALGYAAALVLAADRISGRGLGKALNQAGRMAFSNYIGTTVLMTAIFYGWGLGLVGTVGRAGQLWFVFAAWLAMLAGSSLWLARFRQGPLEWLWRSLTEGKLQPMRGGAQSRL